MRAPSCLLLLLPALLLSCSSADDVGPNEVIKTIGPFGGVVELEGRIWLSIPTGTLDQEYEIHITDEQRTQEGYSSGGSVFYIEPETVVLSQAVTVYIRMEDEPDRPALYVSDPNVEGDWIELQTTIEDDEWASAFLGHFGWVFVADGAVVNPTGDTGFVDTAPQDTVDTGDTGDTATYSGAASRRPDHGWRIRVDLIDLIAPLFRLDR